MRNAVVWGMFILVVGVIVFPLPSAGTGTLTVIALKKYMHRVFFVFRVGQPFVTVWFLSILAPVVVWLWTGRSEPPSATRTANRIMVIARSAMVLFLIDRVLTIATLGYLSVFIADDGAIPLLVWFLVGGYSLVLSARLRRPDLVVRSVFSMIVPLGIFLDHVAYVVYVNAHGLR